MSTQRLAQLIENELREALDDNTADDLGIDMQALLQEVFESEEGRKLLTQTVRDCLLGNKELFDGYVKEEVERMLDEVDSSETIQSLLESDEAIKQAIVTKAREFALANIDELEEGCEIDTQVNDFSLTQEELEKVLRDEVVQNALMGKARELALEHIRQLDENDDIASQVAEALVLDEQTLATVVSDREMHDELVKRARNLAMQKMEEEDMLGDAIERMMVSSPTVQHSIDRTLDAYAHSGGLERLLDEMLNEAQSDDRMRERIKRTLLDRLLDRMADRMLERMRL